MADPQAATVTQLKKIQARIGQSIEALHAAVAGSGATKHGERRSWLMDRFKLGYGNANAVANFFGKPPPDLGGGVAPVNVVVAGDPLDTIYAGPKAAFHPLHGSR